MENLENIHRKQEKIIKEINSNFNIKKEHNEDVKNEKILAQIKTILEKVKKEMREIKRDFIDCVIKYMESIEWNGGRN